ncbi:hypothetical protein MHYP_G00313310 [Metynnis hypsauchen]
MSRQAETEVKGAEKREGVELLLLLVAQRFQRLLSLLRRLSAELVPHLQRRPPRKPSLPASRARRRLRVRSSAVCERGLH